MDFQQSARSLQPELSPPGDRTLRSTRLHGAAMLLALLLLAAAIGFVYRDAIAHLLGANAPVQPEFAYITDLDFWQRTPRESDVVANAYFDLDHDLNSVPMNVGSWAGVDRPETNEEVMILLEPEQYIQRLYQNERGNYLWLTMVGGRSSQPFHAPDICYDADGWQYSLGSHPVTLEDGGDLYGLYLTAHKEVPDPADATRLVNQEHVVFYFYLFPDAGRSLSDGIVLFKLTTGRIGTVEETLAIHEDFVRQFFRSARPIG